VVKLFVADVCSEYLGSDFNFGSIVGNVDELKDEDFNTEEYQSVSKARTLSL